MSPSDGPDAARFSSCREKLCKSTGWRIVPISTARFPYFIAPIRTCTRLSSRSTNPTMIFPSKMAEVVRKLAHFEHRPLWKCLNHLLLPPADVLRFEKVVRTPNRARSTLGQAVGTARRRASYALVRGPYVLHPQRYHPRLSRSEAEQFFARCRIGQTERGSFTMALACPLDVVPGR